MNPERKIRPDPGLKAIIISLFIALAAMSCARTIDARYDYQSIGDYLNSRLNIMTWDEAIMTWGQPGSTFQGDEVFIATWGGEKSSGVVFPVNKAIFIAPIESGWQMRLTFNKKSRKLVNWQYNKW